MAVDKNMLIDMDPEIAQAYAASTAVSSRYNLLVNLNTIFNIASKGIGANMLKIGTKRRRTTAQIAAEKEEAAFKEVAI